MMILPFYFNNYNYHSALPLKTLHNLNLRTLNHPQQSYHLPIYSSPPSPYLSYPTHQHHHHLTHPGYYLYTPRHQPNPAHELFSHDFTTKLKTPYQPLLGNAFYEK